jgi:hypothetical protein
MVFIHMLKTKLKKLVDYFDKSKILYNDIIYDSIFKGFRLL